jgi:UrcA family protein
MFCGAMVFSHAAMAQPDGAAPVESQEITVFAPEVVKKPGKGPFEVVSTSQAVDFADLDLTRPADIDTLRKRIKDAARLACRRLDQSAPLGRTYSEPPGCEAKATMEPLALVDQLAAAAAQPQ